MEVDVKTLELDKICRVCLTVKKDMRPLFGEMVAEMLMECTRIQVILSNQNKIYCEKKKLIILYNLH